MKILLTGKNSFIGKNFIANNNKYTVDEICLIENPVTSIDFSTYDVIIHLAAIVHQTKKITEKEYFKINSDLAYEVAYNSKKQGVKHFIFMSTVKVYGENTYDKPWDCYSPCKPVDSYGKSKYDAESRIMHLNENDFCVSIIRTPVVYGPGVKGNIFLIMKLLKLSPIIPLGNINNKRSMVYIGNLIDLINKIIECRTIGIYIAGDGVSYSTSLLAREIANAMDKKRIFIGFPKLFIAVLKKYKQGFYNRLFGNLEVDNRESFKKLNFKPQYSLRVGIKETIRYNLKS